MPWMECIPMGEKPRFIAHHLLVERTVPLTSQSSAAPAGASLPPTAPCQGKRSSALR